MEGESVEERLEEIYALIPKVKCKRLCQAYCGPVIMSAAEYKRTNMPTLRSLLSGRLKACPALDMAGGECRIYTKRPAICRLFGAVDAELLRCPYNCGVEGGRKLTNEEARTILNELELLSNEQGEKSE